MGSQSTEPETTKPFHEMINTTNRHPYVFDPSKPFNCEQAGFFFGLHCGANDDRSACVDVDAEACRVIEIGEPESTMQYEGGRRCSWYGCDEGIGNCCRPAEEFTANSCSYITTTTKKKTEDTEGAAAQIAGALIGTFALFAL